MKKQASNTATLDRPDAPVKLQCKHCGYTWVARLDTSQRLPLCCPSHCPFQWYWNTDEEHLTPRLKKLRKTYKRK